MLKVAITGNIASGKSQIENIIKSKGYVVFDTDEIAHNILDSISEFNGYDVFTDGKIDRKKLGKIVFSDSGIKKELEQIVHPKVKSEILNLFELNKEKKCVFISVPLLFEAGFEKIFDKVILVTVDENMQLERLMKRNNFSREEALLRIRSQISQSEKISKSDYVIENDGSIEELRIKTEKVISRLLC